MGMGMGMDPMMGDEFGGPMGPMEGPMGFFDEFLGFDGGRADQKAMFDDFGSDMGAASNMFFDMLAQPGPGDPFMMGGGFGDPFGDPFGGGMGWRSYGRHGNGT